MSFIIQSSAFGDGQAIPRRHTGDGEDLSPPLEWRGIPAASASLALVVDDPDAPTNEPWVHWVIYQIAVASDSLPEGIPPIVLPPFPPGVHQGRNSWKTAGYRGPAPPKGHGVHRYFFKLHALDKALELPEGLDKTGLLKAIEPHTIAVAEMMGTYER
jgi:Raf kinase inhibitor-like YbhB/YbcL family protein